MYIIYSDEHVHGNKNHRYILKCKGEEINGKNVVKITEDMVQTPFDHKQSVVYDIKKKKIIPKEMIEQK